MKNIKTERAVYAAWDYELELEHLNKMSEQGWQLIHGGCFHTKYERNEGVVYRYQLDHNMKIENRMRYIDTYREQGWEYINSTFNGWHYFRKVYDPEKPPEEYEIYSDRPSKQEMASRLGKVLLVLSVMVAALLIMGIIAMVKKPEMAYLGIIFEMTAGLALAATGYVRMKRIGNGEQTSRKFRVEAFIAAVVLGFVWFLVFASAGQTLNMQTSGGLAEVSFEIRLPDWINVKVSCESAEEMNVLILDDQGEAIYISQGTAVVAGENVPLNFEQESIFLMPGSYTARVECKPETSIAVTVD